MMIQEIEKKIKDSYYWDARVKSLECNYFGDEVKIVFEDEKKDITYFFSKCYKVLIEHDVEYIKEIFHLFSPGSIVKINRYHIQKCCRFNDTCQQG